MICRVICVFAICAILSVNCGVILDKITNDLHKIQTDLDQQMKQIGNYFNQNLQQNRNWFQNGFNPQPSYGQPAMGQGSFPETGNGFNSGNGFNPGSGVNPGNGAVFKQPELEQKSGSGLVVTSEVSNKVEISTETSATASESTTKKEGRRIISAHSNCPPGYAADSRGRCREHF